ncbi:hypothetical protein HWV62_30461 [Athelia sp. TMB]|nr:hypothetical protein HWV62_30461 [Athelia sp. TMB]
MSSPCKVPEGCLPSSTCSVASLLQLHLPLPAHVDCPSALLKKSSLKYFSKDQPTCSDIRAIETIPVPHLKLINKLNDALTDACEKGMQAVKVLHCSGPRTDTLPLWAIAYWLEVTRVLAIRSTYARAESFLSYKAVARLDGRGTKLNVAVVKQEALDSIYRLGWNDKIAGFNEDQYVHELMPFASDDWLQTMHMGFYLELIKLKLSRAGVRGVVMVSPFFLVKVFHAYEARESGAYDKASDYRFVRRLGTLIAQTEDDLYSIGNVNDDHWVPFIIAPGTSIVHFANSMVKGNSIHALFKAAITWWLQQHFARTFAWKIMRITQQLDGFSCGILAGNCLEHHYLGDKAPLVEDDQNAASTARVFVLSQILRHHFLSQSIVGVSSPLVNLHDEDTDESIFNIEKTITEILDLPQEARSTTRKMLKQLPQYSLETLTLLRLYGDRAYALVAEDPEVVKILTDRYAEEPQLLRRLRLAHAQAMLEIKSASVVAEARWDKMAQKFTPSLLREDAFHSARDVSSDDFKPSLLGPDTITRSMMNIAGNRKRDDKIPVLDTSIDKLQASLASVDLEGWGARVESIHHLVRRVECLNEDLIAGKI